MENGSEGVDNMDVSISMTKCIFSGWKLQVLDLGVDAESRCDEALVGPIVRRFFIAV